LWVIGARGHCGPACTTYTDLNSATLAPFFQPYGPMPAHSLLNK
jgi:hypothetical protein